MNTFTIRRFAGGLACAGLGAAASPVFAAGP